MEGEKRIRVSEASGTHQWTSQDESIYNNAKEEALNGIIFATVKGQ